MAAQLRIRFDGEVPGLAEHRLSLAGFGEPLALLLKALRRIATQIVGSATDAEHPRTGRFANLARLLDIELISIEGGSSGFDAVVSFAHPPDELKLFADLPERSVTELLEAIVEESQGHLRNASVRRYLEALPKEVHKQVYDLHENGATKKHVEIGDLALTDLPLGLPSLREFTGNVVGVGFPPGKPEVRVKSGPVSTALDADEPQVDTALQLRKDAVRLLGVDDGSRKRLLRIERATDQPFKMTHQSIENHIFKRWSNVFARLSTT